MTFANNVNTYLILDWTVGFCGIAGLPGAVVFSPTLQFDPRVRIALQALLAGTRVHHAVNDMVPVHL